MSSSSTTTAGPFSRSGLDVGAATPRVGQPHQSKDRIYGGGAWFNAQGHLHWSPIRGVGAFIVQASKASAKDPDFDIFHCPRGDGAAPEDALFDPATALRVGWLWQRTAADVPFLSGVYLGFNAWVNTTRQKRSEKSPDAYMTIGARQTRDGGARTPQAATSASAGEDRAF